jgi:hypothetical protein
MQQSSKQQLLDSLNQMSATQVASPNTNNTDNTDNGLSFEVHEIEEFDDISTPSRCGSSSHFHSSPLTGYLPGLDKIDESSPISELDPTSPMMLNPLMHSSLSAITSPTAAANAVTSPKPTFQCSPAMATADGMYPPPSPSSDDAATNDVLHASPPASPAIRTHPNVKRLQFGDNPETIATLAFLETQRINTTSLVMQHIVKYGSRARIAQTDDGQIVGFAMFDNEIDQEKLQDQARHVHPDELKKIVDAKPFIFLQLLVMDPQFVASTNTGNEWKKELVAQFCDCVTKNGKIAIARTETENQTEIEFFQSCGFFTMHDMGIPSYPSSKGTDISVLAYTPMGKEGTAEIFRKFYSMGARF